MLPFQLVTPAPPHAEYLKETEQLKEISVFRIRFKWFQGPRGEFI